MPSSASASATSISASASTSTSTSASAIVAVVAVSSTLPRHEIDVVVRLPLDPLRLLTSSAQEEPAQEDRVLCRLHTHRPLRGIWAAK